MAGYRPLAAWKGSATGKLTGNAHRRGNARFEVDVPRMGFSSGSAYERFSPYPFVPELLKELFDSAITFYNEGVMKNRESKTLSYSVFYEQASEGTSTRSRHLVNLGRAARIRVSGILGKNLACAPQRLSSGKSSGS